MHKCHVFLTVVEKHFCFLMLKFYFNQIRSSSKFDNCTIALIAAVIRSNGIKFFEENSLSNSVHGLIFI
jgi:hypothetical protein